MSGEFQPSVHDSGSQAKSHGHNSCSGSLSPEPKKNKSEATRCIDLSGSSSHFARCCSFHFPSKACLCVWEVAIKHGFENHQEVVENGMINPTAVQQCLIIATVEEMKKGGMWILPDCNSGCPLVSSPPFFNGQLWSGQDPICVGANTVEHEGDEWWHDRSIDRWEIDRWEIS